MTCRLHFSFWIYKAMIDWRFLQSFNKKVPTKCNFAEKDRRWFTKFYSVKCNDFHFCTIDWNLNEYDVEVVCRNLLVRAKHIVSKLLYKCLPNKEVFKFIIKLLKLGKNKFINEKIYQSMLKIKRITLRLTLRATRKKNEITKILRNPD